jgi:hypothetical protein
LAPRTTLAKPPQKQPKFFFNLHKGTREPFRQRKDIPDLKKINKAISEHNLPSKKTKQALFKFINKHNVRLAVEPEPSGLSN